jgi:hypothetical protein
MSDRAEPDELVKLLHQLETLGRQLFAAGYRGGTMDSQDSMLRASQAVAERKIPSLLPPGAPSVGSSNLSPPHYGGRMSPPRTGLAGAPRSYPYGAVISLIRQSVLENPAVGMRVPDMITYCREHGVDATPNAVRDAVKRLRGGEEIERHQDAYFPGPRLQGHSPQGHSHAPGRPPDDLWAGARGEK